MLSMVSRPLVVSVRCRVVVRYLLRSSSSLTMCLSNCTVLFANRVLSEERTIEQTSQNEIIDDLGFTS